MADTRIPRSNAEIMADQANLGGEMAAARVAPFDDTIAALAKADIPTLVAKLEVLKALFSGSEQAPFQIWINILTDMNQALVKVAAANKAEATTWLTPVPDADAAPAEGEPKAA